MPDDPAAPTPPEVADAQAAASPPIGISSTHIFIVALLAIISFEGVAFWVLLTEPNSSNVAAIMQAAIGMAQLAFGYFLGSSAGARNRSAQP